MVLGVGDWITHGGALSGVRQLDAARALVQAGDWIEAERACTAILDADPQNAGAWHLLGVIAARHGMAERAIELIERAHRVGRPNARSLNDLGTAYLAAGHPDDAKRCFKKAVSHRADDAEAHANLGRALMQLGQTRVAEQSLRRATTLRPNYSHAWFWLGNLLREQGRLNDAERSFRLASAVDPRNTEFQNNLAIVLSEMGRREEAEACFRSVLALSPDHLPARHNLAKVLTELGHLGEAELMYRSVLARDSGAFATRVNLAGVLQNLGRMSEAIAEYRAVLAAQPSVAAVHYALGNALYKAGETQAAQGSYRRALELDPDLGAARWGAVVNQLPAVYGVGEDPVACRAAYARSLRELSDWIGRHFMDAGSDVIGSPPFYLVYQEEDNRALMTEYGAVCARLMAQWPDLKLLRSPARTAKGRVRVGIVSTHFRDHSVWNALVKGWVVNIDRARVDLSLFNLDLGSREDDETRLARAAVAQFEQGKSGLREWAEAILASELDVLLYPEIGMDELTAKLASLRLAPIQAATWGHPDTTGLPTVDYYLSAEGLEGPGAADHYSERLVLLPGLGCYVEPVAAADQTMADPPMREKGDGPILVCPGTPFKYAPKYDWVFPEIASRLGRCRMIFFEYATRAYSDKLRERLSHVFAERGMAFDRFAVFVPWQSREAFHATLKGADLYLDTLGFSGFNTALQAVDCSLPIVTRDARFLRGRLASGILRRIGLGALVASTTEEYVDLVVSLAQDSVRRQEIRQVMERERHALYGDLGPVRALELFLIGAAQRNL